MSSHTYCGVVPFKVVLWKGDLGDRNVPPPVQKILYALEDDREPKKAKVIGLWEIPGGDAFKEFGDLLGIPIRKDERRVYYINSHEFSGGGGEEVTIISESEEDLQTFCQDLGFNIKIEKGQAVMQVL